MAEQPSNVQTEEEEQQHQEHQDAPPQGEEPEAPPAPETDEDQFSRLLRERREGKAPKPEPPAPDEGDEAPPDDAQGEQQPRGQDPVEPGSDQSPPAVGTDDGNEQSWFANLPEEARQQMNQQQQYLDHLHANYKALHNRLAPIQRQNEDLRKRLQEIEAKPAPTLKDLEEHHAWKDVSTELPDEAGELKKVFTSQAQALQQASDRQKMLNQALEQERQERLATEMRRLAVRHPNVHTVRSHPLFSQWRQAVESNPQVYPQVVQKLGSPYYEDIADVLDQFKADLAEAHPQVHAQIYATAGNQQQAPAQGQARQPKGQRVQRPKPPNPSPPSQGSGMSGAQRQRAPMTDEERFSEYLRNRKRR